MAARTDRARRHRDRMHDDTTFLSYGLDTLDDATEASYVAEPTALRGWRR